MVVILLFIGVAVQPVIIADVSNESNDSEKVEITVEICEIDKTYNHSMMLTLEQACELSGIIDSFEKKINRATTFEETNKITSDLAVSLNEYGLLPEDLSVEGAKKIITCNNLHMKINRFMEKISRRNNNNNSPEIINSLCVIYASIFNKPTVTIDFNLLMPISFLFLALYVLVDGFYYYKSNNSPILGWLFVFTHLYYQLKPLRLMNLIIIESIEPYSVYSIGLLGNKKTTAEPYQHYGMFGYTGLIIKFNCEPFYEFFDCKMIFIGSALQTRLV